MLNLRLAYSARQHYKPALPDGADAGVSRVDIPSILPLLPQAPVFPALGGYRSAAVFFTMSTLIPPRPTAAPTTAWCAGCRCAARRPSAAPAAPAAPSTAPARLPRSRGRRRRGGPPRRARSRRARPAATCPRARVANALGSGRPGGRETRRKQPANPRWREGGKGSGALGEQRGGWRRSANTIAAGEYARTAGASASITATGASARTAGARASAIITARGAGARTGGARASASITTRGAPARSAGVRSAQLCAHAPAVDSVTGGTYTDPAHCAWHDRWTEITPFQYAAALGGKGVLHAGVGQG